MLLSVDERELGAGSELVATATSTRTGLGIWRYTHLASGKRCFYHCYYHSDFQIHFLRPSLLIFYTICRLTQVVITFLPWTRGWLWCQVWFHRRCLTTSWCRQHHQSPVAQRRQSRQSEHSSLESRRAVLGSALRSGLRTMDTDQRLLFRFL